MLAARHREVVEGKLFQRGGGAEVERYKFHNTADVWDEGSTVECKIAVAPLQGPVLTFEGARGAWSQGHSESLFSPSSISGSQSPSPRFQGACGRWLSSPSLSAGA